MHTYHATCQDHDLAQSNTPIASSSVVSPPSKTSSVWQHFSFVKDDHGKLLNESPAICKLCGQKFAHGGGMTNPKNHLQTKHRPTYNELTAGSLTEREESSLDEFVWSIASE